MGLYMLVTAPVLALSIAMTPTVGGFDTAHAFKQAVARYMEIRRVREPMALDPMTVDRELIERWRHTLAAGIRDARVAAIEGDVFSPEMAALIRHRMRRALVDADSLAVWRLGVGDEARQSATAIGINESLPWGWSVRVPPSLLACLPAVPSELEYRLVGADLVLWDAGADVIVDIARHVLPDR